MAAAPCRTKSAGCWQVNSALLTRAWALAAIAFGGAALLLLARGAPLQTNLLALLPPTERSAAAERAVAAMHDAAENRAVFLVGHRDAATAKEAARRFAAELEASRAFKRVQLEVPAADPRPLLRANLDYRFGLLAEADRLALHEGKIDAGQPVQRRRHTPPRLPPPGRLG